MFALHDSTRRLLCLAAFVALGLAPTLWTIVWCVGRHSPTAAVEEAQRLSLSLGLRVTLDRVEYLKPGVRVYHGLQLADPETGRVLARCTSLRCACDSPSIASSQPASSVQLTAQEAEVNAEGLGELARLLQRMMESRLDWSNPNGRLEVGQLAFHHGGTVTQFQAVQGRIASLPAGPQAELAFRLKQQPGSEPVRIRFGRNRQMNPPASGFELSTGGTALPCSLLALGLPEFARCGARPRWDGKLWANQMSDGWQGALSGKLLGLDLAELFSHGYPHKLSGSADLELQVARFRQGRLEEAAGVLIAGPGLISRSLLDAAVMRLGLARGLEPGVPGDLVPYQELAAGFVVDYRGLAVRGRAGTILADSRGPLLGDSAAASLPLAGVLQLLVPESDASIPASRQAQRLMQWLPLPESLAPAVTARRRAGSPE